MIVSRAVASVSTAALVAAGALVVAAPAQAAAQKTYANCTSLNRVWPHGVGKPGAHDKTSGTPVTSFKRSTPLYNANRKSDRDGDGIACEKA